MTEGWAISEVVFGKRNKSKCFEIWVPFFFEGVSCSSLCSPLLSSFCRDEAALLHKEDKRASLGARPLHLDSPGKEACSLTQHARVKRPPAVPTWGFLLFSPLPGRSVFLSQETDGSAAWARVPEPLVRGWWRWGRRAEEEHLP